MKKRKRAVTTILCAAVAALFILVCLGYIWPNKFFAARYEVRGIDVSHHQGAIDWRRVAENKDVRFAYVKATEGSNFVDHLFSENWSGAGEAGIVRGAYHYFTLTSPGAWQAENFISAVPAEKGCLPPAIDLEEDGWEKADFVGELENFISAVEQRYGCKPVLYVTYPIYDEYIKGEFDEYPVWIRAIELPPSLGDREWLLWQYFDRGGISGIGANVDLDAFNGGASEFEALLTR